MEYILYGLIGAIVSCIVTLVFIQRKSGYGYFITRQINEEEYTINVRIPNPIDQKLYKKRIIILTKEPSQK